MTYAYSQAEKGSELELDPQVFRLSAPGYCLEISDWTNNLETTFTNKEI